MLKRMTKQRRVEEGQRVREQLLGNLWAQGADMQEIAQAMNMSLTQLSELASDRMFRMTVKRLCMLGDMRSRLITSRYRVHAAAKLVALASEGEGEVARKASVDLLKLGLGTGRKKAVGRAEREKERVDEGEAGMGLMVDGEELAGVAAALRELGEVEDE